MQSTINNHATVIYIIVKLCIYEGATKGKKVQAVYDDRNEEKRNESKVVGKGDRVSKKKGLLARLQAKKD